MYTPYPRLDRSNHKHHNHTPSHKHMAFELFPWIPFKGMGSSESHLLPLHYNFPALLLSLPHKSPLARLPSLCLKNLHLLESPQVSSFPSSGKCPPLWSSPCSFPETVLTRQTQTQNRKPRGQGTVWTSGSSRQWAWGQRFLSPAPMALPRA